MDKKAIIEGVKEVLRIAYLAAAVAVLGYASEKLNMLDPTSTFYIVGTLALKFADKVVHKSERTKRSGIAPF